MNARLTALTALTAMVVVACFGVGVVLGRKTGDAKVPHAMAAASGEGGAIVSALPAMGRSSTRAARALSQLARSGEHGFFVRFRGYLRLVREAEVEEFPNLIRQIGREVPGELGGEALIELLAKRWVAEAPLEALEALLRLDPRDLLSVEYDILKGVAESEPREAWKVLQGIRSDGSVMVGGALTNGGFRDRAMGSLLQEVAIHDPALALELTISLDQPGRYKDGIRRGVMQLAKVDPARAIEAYKSLESHLRLQQGVSGQGDVVLTAFYNLAEGEIASAVAAMDGLGRDDRERAANGIAARIAKDDPSAALEWIKALPSDVPGEDALVSVLGLQASSDPAAAAANVVEVPAPNTRAALSGKVALAWYDVDEEAALAWARDDLEGSARSNAFAGMLKEKGEEMEFALQLEMADAIPGDHDAKSGFVERWAVEDPEAAANWAIPQSGRSTRLFESAIETWATTDPEALQSFAAGLDSEKLKGIANDRAASAMREAAEQEARK